MSSSVYTAQRTLFKAYDIRGERQLFDAEFCKVLSLALAQHFIDNARLNHAVLTTVVIGYDVRQGSKDIAKQLATGFCQLGIDVIWLGLITTPMMAYWANQYQGHGLIATASHSPAHYNGIKWLLNGESPSSANIQSIYAKLATAAIASNATTQQHNNALQAVTREQQGTLSALDSSVVKEQYINTIAKALQHLNNKKNVQLKSPHSSTPPYRFKVVIDCLNGTTGAVAESFFSRFTSFFSDIIILNATADSDFRKGNPDPMEEQRLTELCQAVINHQADIGLSFDGDGDRLMVIDHKGNPLTADHLLYLLARVAVEDYEHTHTKDKSTPHSSDVENEKPIVIFDVKCSHHMPLLLSQIGAVAEMTKTGSSIFRRMLQSKKESSVHKIIFAGELSGHFIFNDGYFLLHDDAMYAALRLINWLQQQQQEQDSTHTSSTYLADTISNLPTMVSTADVYLPLDTLTNVAASTTSTLMPEIKKQPILNRLTQLCQKLQSNHESLMCHLPKDTHLTCIDGLRLDFSHGFGIIRSSRTSNSLTVRFAGDSITDLQNVQNCFVNLCRSISDELATQVANIQAKP